MLNKKHPKVVASEDARSRPASSWTDFCSLRWRGIDKPSSRLGKIALEGILKDLQLPHLKVLRTFASAQEISLSGLPDTFVLKPSALWSGRGVMLLHRVSGAPHYFDAKSGRVVAPSDVLTEAKDLERKVGKQLTFMIEERALDENEEKLIPLDYKVFTFYGKTEFILQVDRNYKTPRLAFFDGHFSSINDSRVFIPQPKEDSYAVPRVPHCAEGIIALARDITRSLKAPFISVDCYATTRGAVFGELTHTPGGPWYGAMYRFSDDFDEYLGSAWKAALDELGLPVHHIDSPYSIRNGSSIKRYVE